MFNDLAHWLEKHALTCSYREWLGIECPGCGFQRALVLLLRGEFWASVEMYPPLIPILLLFTLLGLHLGFRFKQGALWLKYGFIFCITLIALNYIHKTLHVFGLW